MCVLQKEEVKKVPVAAAIAATAVPVPSRPPQMNRQAAAAGAIPGSHSQLSPASGEPDSRLDSSPGDGENTAAQNGGFAGWGLTCVGYEICKSVRCSEDSSTLSTDR